MAEAFHVVSEAGDIVGLGELRVLVTPDGDGWFAQALEIDYSAGGDSIEDVKARFERGLTLTIGKHLETYGSIDKLLVVAPREAWAAFYAAGKESQKHLFSQLSLHKQGPFDSIRYYQLAA
jgi:hypothetical protein